MFDDRIPEFVATGKDDEKQLHLCIHFPLLQQISHCNAHCMFIVHDLDIMSSPISLHSRGRIGKTIRPELVSCPDRQLAELIMGDERWIVIDKAEIRPVPRSWLFEMQVVSRHVP